MIDEEIKEGVEAIEEPLTPPEDLTPVEEEEE